MDSMGMQKSEVSTSATVVLRTNVANKPYDDKRVRNALQLAVDNATVLKLGYNDAGTVAENHHVCPIHPEYAELPKVARDIEKAKALMTEAGQMDTEFELISYDAEYVKNPGDVIAAQCREAGFKIKRTVIPGSSFWNDWTKYPWSTTEWNMRPLGVQVLALAYRTGEAWNESAFSNPDFDAKLAEALSIADADKRREVMKDVESILPGLRRDHPVVLALDLSPLAALCAWHVHAPDLRGSPRKRLAGQVISAKLRKGLWPFRHCLRRKQQ
ncbi:MAG: ABC transporter substrate-binding protein [Nitratireductor sp.]